MTQMNGYATPATAKPRQKTSPTSNWYCIGYLLGLGIGLILGTNRHPHIWETTLLISIFWVVWFVAAHRGDRYIDRT